MINSLVRDTTTMYVLSNMSWKYDLVREQHIDDQYKYKIMLIYIEKVHKIELSYLHMWHVYGLNVQIIK